MGFKLEDWLRDKKAPPEENFKATVDFIQKPDNDNVQEPDHNDDETPHDSTPKCGK